MSMQDSWIVIAGEAKEKLFAEFGLEETGEEGQFRNVGKPYSYLDLGGGRLLLYCNEWGLADEVPLKLLSAGREVLACQYQDQVEEPSAVICVVRNGDLLWRVSTDGDDVTVTGEPPAEFEPIRQEYARQIGDDPDVAIMYEVAHDLGRALCGFAVHEDDRPMKGLRVLADSPLKGDAFPRTKAPNLERLFFGALLLLLILPVVILSLLKSL